MFDIVKFLSIIAAKAGFNMKQTEFAHELADIFYGNVNDYNISAVFYLTRHCNLACPDCYMFANPDVPKTMLPVDDIKFYMSELKTLPNFYPAACFSGGEVFTLPLDYLRENIVNGLKAGLFVDLKTNGVWVTDDKKCRTVFDMLRSIDVPGGLYTPNMNMLEFIRTKKMHWGDKKKFRLYRALVLRNPYKCLDYLAKLSKNKWNCDLMDSPLSLTVSVDNTVHVADSGGWFMDIVNRIVKDEELRQKIMLGRVTIMNPGTEYKKHTFSIFRGYGVNVLKSEKVSPESSNYFNGEWIKKPIYENGELVSQGLINLFFWPDRTVALDSHLNFQPIGRVSYVNPDGSYKKMPEIIDDMVAQLMRDSVKYQR